MSDFTVNGADGHPVAGIDYPADLAQFRAWFPDDQACLDYLDWLRWPAGFVCPHCQAGATGRDQSDRYRCAGCRRRVSVTTDTIFQDTRVPLSVWFEAAWLLTVNKNTGVSAAHMHRILPINSYQTAWTMLAKFRSVMHAANSALLAGRVEIDETFFGGPKAGVRGRGALGKTMVAGAIEVTETGWGRARLGVITDAKAPTLQRFIRTTIEPSSTIVTDGLTSYPAATIGYVHEPISVTATGRPAHESLPAVHRLFAQVKRSIDGTYQGSGTAGHLQEYLDEFIFRFNRRKSTSRGLVFMRLLQRAMTGSPVTYRQLVRQPSPKTTRPRGVKGPRSQPSSLVQLTVARPWRAPRKRR